MRMRITRVLPHLIIFAFLYGNVTVLIKNCTRLGSLVEGQLSPLPAPDSYFVLFDTIAVFKTLPKTNWGYVAYGLTEMTNVPPTPGNEEHVKIDLYEMLDLPLTEVNLNWGAGGFAARAAPEAKRDMANRVQAYHNKAHPDNPVLQVWVFEATWPPHDHNYWGNFDHANFTPWARN